MAITTAAICTLWVSFPLFSIVTPELSRFLDMYSIGRPCYSLDSWVCLVTIRLANEPDRVGLGRIIGRESSCRFLLLL